jgi:hypothetical protein
VPLIFSGREMAERLSVTLKCVIGSSVEVSDDVAIAGGAEDDGSAGVDETCVTSVRRDAWVIARTAWVGGRASMVGEEGGL